MHRPGIFGSSTPIHYSLLKATMILPCSLHYHRYIHGLNYRFPFVVECWSKIHCLFPRYLVRWSGVKTFRF